MRRSPKSRAVPKLLVKTVSGSLYHGTSSLKPFRMPSGPAWFGDKRDTALFFSQWNKESLTLGGPRRILKYEVVRSPSLIGLDMGAEVAAYGSAPTGAGEKFEVIEKAFRDILGYDVGETMLDMAVDICRERFDGWVIRGFYDDREGGGSDILLCEPHRWLELVGVEWIDEPPRCWKSGLQVRTNPPQGMMGDMFDDVVGLVPGPAVEEGRRLFAKVARDTRICGDSNVVVGWWIETHTFGCRNAADVPESAWAEEHEKLYDEYLTDGMSRVVRDWDSGIFVTFTPQRGTRKRPGRRPARGRRSNPSEVAIYILNGAPGTLPVPGDTFVLATARKPLQGTQEPTVAMAMADGRPWPSDEHLGLRVVSLSTADHQGQQIPLLLLERTAIERNPDRKWWGTLLLIATLIPFVPPL